MKRIERTLSIILLFVISFSNVSAPLAYAAEDISSSTATISPEKQNTAPVAPPKFPQPDTGSVLGDSTSLFEIGTQEGNQTSASQHVPIRMQQLPKKVYDTDENVTLAVTNPDNEPFTTSVTNAQGQIANVPITETNNGTTTDVQLQASNEIRPGNYMIKVIDQEGNVTTQDFSWGVLAMNTDKTEYHPNETANISFGVLDDKGNMVCDSSLTLQITNLALGINDTLSTDNGKIQENAQCQQHGFSLQPDYSAQYQFGKSGTYTFTLTATTQNGTHAITQTVPVTDNIPFDVQRVSATRIYPLNTYPMTFNITAHQDFSGVVTESVPQDFTITPATESASAVSYDNMQTVYLNSNDPGVQLSQAIAASASAGGLVMPFHGNYPITQGFGAQMTDPTLQAFYTQYGLAGHDGVDFGVPMDTPLYAVDDGTIMEAGPGDYGTTIIIQHAWGESYYGHLSTTAVNVGTHVTKGQLIGYSGESGEATGPHLHFGIKPLHPDNSNGYYGKVDPLPYLPYNNAQASSALSTLNPALADATVLAASTSADQPTPEVTDSLTPTASPAALVSPLPTPTATPAIAQPVVSATPSAQPAPTNNPNFQIQTGSSSANENFSVLDKQILTSEELANSSNTEKVKVITWHVTLKNGQSTTLGYDYQGPHVSPEFYLLGPMQFYQNGSNKVVFQEQRQWQIASDDVGIEWYSNTTGNKFNGYSWQYRKKIAINHTKVAGSGGSGTVTYDNSSGAEFAPTSGHTPASSLSWSQSVGSSCTDPLLVVMTATYNGDTMTVTDNGTSMTHLATSTNSTANSSEIWYMKGVGTSNSIVVNVSPADDIVGGSVSFCNANQTTPFGTSVTATGTGSPVSSGSMTVSTGEMLVDSFAFEGNTSPWSPGSGQTQAWSTDAVNNGGAASYESIISSGTKSMSWSPGNNADTWAEVAAPINPDSVGGGGSLADFPVLINLSDTGLGTQAQSSGNDILFTDSTGENLIPFEIENYTSSAGVGTLVAWVQISSLSSTSDTIIYMYYGNPSATSHANASGVWSSTNYKAVYHLGPTTFGGSTLSVADSLGVSNGTNNGATYNASGEISGAASFNGTSSNVSAAGTGPQITGSKTLEAWVNATTFSQYSSGTDRRIIFDNMDGNHAYQLTTCISSGSSSCTTSGSGFVWAVNSASGTQFIASAVGYSTGTWYFVVGTYNSTGNVMQLYVNGSAVSGGGATGPYGIASTGSFFLGERDDPTAYFSGSIDEVRIANTVLTSQWIATEYNNDSSPDIGGFLTSVGNQETNIYAPTMAQVMRHGEWFSAEGAVQPFTF